MQIQSAGRHPVIYRTDTDCKSLYGRSFVTDGDAHVYLHTGVDICRVVQRHISKVSSVQCVQSVSSGPRTDPLRDTASTMTAICNLLCTICQVRADPFQCDAPDAESKLVADATGGHDQHNQRLLTGRADIVVLLVAYLPPSVHQTTRVASHNARLSSFALYSYAYILLYFKIRMSEYLRSKRAISRLDDQKIYRNFRTPSKTQGAFVLAVLAVQTAKPAAWRSNQPLA